ncbi:MAG: ketol-acid reductoisomerase [Candidatus Binatia bacterium]
MVKVFYDQDADLSYLQGKTVAIIGYGNQGSAQALNLRDSGLQVIVGSIGDESAERAKTDGFHVVPISEAVCQGDVVSLLIPDELQETVYETDIRTNLSSEKVLNFAHGYNLRFGLITPPADIDVIMVAPRMIGVNLRKAFLKGNGVPAYVAVWQDASGQAKQIMLAVAKAIGATRSGVIETTVAEETELDLFTEQAVWPIIMRNLLLAYEVLVAEGFPPEIVVLELFASGEAAEIFQQMARLGFFEQLQFHSHTSRYGTLSRSERMLPDEVKEKMHAVLQQIRSGDFTSEWEEERQRGYPRLLELNKQAANHPITQAEETVHKLVKIFLPK